MLSVRLEGENDLFNGNYKNCPCKFDKQCPFISVYHYTNFKRKLSQLQLICPHVSNLLQTLVWSLDSQGKRKITMNENSNASETFFLFFFNARIV